MNYLFTIIFAWLTHLGLCGLITLIVTVTLGSWVEITLSHGCMDTSSLRLCISLWVAVLHMPIARPRSRNATRFYGRDVATRKTGDSGPWLFVASYSHHQYNNHFETVEWSRLAQRLHLLTYRAFRSNNLIEIYSNSWLCFWTLCTVMSVPVAARSKA